MHGTGDPERDVGFVAVFGADDDPEPEAGEVGGVLVAVAQGPADEFAHDGVQAAGEPGSGFDEVPVVVIGAGEKMGRVGVGRQWLVVLRVVALPGGYGGSLLFVTVSSC